MVDLAVELVICSSYNMHIDIKQTTRRTVLARKYPNVKEGKLFHEGNTYEQPTSDEQFVMVVELGNLISVDPLYEVWAWQGIAAIIANDVLGVME